MVRDAADLVPLLCGHYLRIGFDKLVFIDDGSTEGTLELLSSLARRCPAVQVERVSRSAFTQPEVVTEATNSAIRDGFHLVFPFDADEFWNIDCAAIRALARGPGLFVGHWVQFVQNRSHAGSRGALRNIRFRAPLFADTSIETLSESARSFVNLPAPKVGFASEEPVAVSRGQHSLLSGPTALLAEGLELFHLPLRSARQLALRAERSERVLAMAGTGEAWQSRFFARAMKDGRLDEVWAANSASEDGFLDLPGRRTMLIADDRLARLLGKAWRYMAMRFPIWTLLARASEPKGAPFEKLAAAPAS